MSRRTLLSFGGMPAAFWAALVVLVVNDHVLKGSGLLPGVATGKLSDFAGLIVAPLVLCAALSVRTDRGRGLALGAVALGFAAIKLSPSSAAAAGQWLTVLFVPSRIWCDPSDLIAFAVLPWAAQLARRIEPMPGPVARRIAVGVASLACIATSYDYPEPEVLRGPFLINWTQGEIDARVVVRSFPCTAASDDAAARVEVEQRYQLAPAQLVEIAADAAPNSCGEADVQVGTAMTHVSWDLDGSELLEEEVSYSSSVVRDAGYSVSAIYHDDQWAFDRGITAAGSAVHPTFELGKYLRRGGWR